MLKKAFCIFTLISIPVFAQEPKPEISADPQPKIKQINENEYQIGKIHLDKAKQEISFGAGVNMREGLIEYLLVTTHSDKVHETLFVTDISPLNLNIAMKLLGIKESKELFEIIEMKSWKPTGKFPKVTPEVHAASLIDIIIEWRKDGRTTRLPVNELIHHINWPKETESPQPNQEIQTEDDYLNVMQKGPWLSTGSYIHEGRFKADVDGMIFGIYTARQAIANFPGKDRELGDVWTPNKETVPAIETVVKIIVKPHTPPKK